MEDGWRRKVRTQGGMEKERMKREVGRVRR